MIDPTPGGNHDLGGPTVRTHSARINSGFRGCADRTASPRKHTSETYFARTNQLILLASGPGVRSDKQKLWPRSTAPSGGGVDQRGRNARPDFPVLFSVSSFHVPSRRR